MCPFDSLHLMSSTKWRGSTKAGLKVTMKVLMYIFHAFEHGVGHPFICTGGLL